MHVSGVLEPQALASVFLHNSYTILLSHACETYLFCLICILLSQAFDAYRFFHISILLS